MFAILQFHLFFLSLFLVKMLSKSYYTMHVDSYLNSKTLIPSLSPFPLPLSTLFLSLSLSFVPPLYLFLTQPPSFCISLSLSLSISFLSCLNLISFHHAVTNFYH